MYTYYRNIQFSPKIKFMHEEVGTYHYGETTKNHETQMLEMI